MSSIPHARDARVVAERISFTPSGRADDGRLFHELTLSVGRERVGLIGPNGAGKTTLLRLLAGELQPTSGTVHRHGMIAVLPQDFRPAPDEPLAVVLGLGERLARLRRLSDGAGSAADFDAVGDDWDLPERVEALLARLGLGGFTLDRPTGTTSGGEATRVALARLMLARNDILLLDEPTNHLDKASREALYDFVDGWRGGLLCISHDRALLRRVDRIVELSALGVREYGGNYDCYQARRDEDAAAAESELASARAALRSAEREAREVRERQARREARGRKSRADGGIPKILLNTRKGWAESTTARVRSITEREVEERESRVASARERVEERVPPRFDLPATGLPAGRTVMMLDQVTVRFPGESLPVLDRVSLALVGPERVALVGPNGSGKSTLLRVALGGIDPESGSVRRLPGVEVGFLDQHGARLDASDTVLDAFVAAHPDMPSTDTRHTLARFGFPHERALQAMATLSGGERLRASLAVVLGGPRPPSLLVLDEPNNHLDLEALEALESALREYDGALLVVSHDSSFLEAIRIERYVGLPTSGMRLAR